MSVDVLTEIVIRRAVEEVAGYAADPANAPAWYVNITSVRWLDEPHVEVGSRMAFTARFLGRDLTYTYEIVEHDPGHRLVSAPPRDLSRWRPPTPGARSRTAPPG